MSAEKPVTSEAVEHRGPSCLGYWFGIVFWGLGAIACGALAIIGAPEVDHWTILSYFKAQRDVRANVPVVAVLVAMVAGCTAISTALYLVYTTQRDREENEKAVESRKVRETVETYILSQLKYYVGFIIFTFILVIFADYEYGGWKNALAYLIGAFTSWIAGYVGQKTIAAAGAHIGTLAHTAGTTPASLHRANFVASYGLALLQTGNALFFLGAVFLIFEDVKFLIGYVFGKAMLALFDRIASHTYNVTARVQPQASATTVLSGNQLANGWGIASDYSETFVTSIAAAAALGFHPHQTHGMAVPFYFGAIAILADIVGSVFIRIVQDDSSEKIITNRVIKSYRIAATISAAFSVALGALPAFMEYTSWRTYVAWVIGITCALLIRYLSEVYTSISHKFTTSVTEAAEVNQTRAYIRSLGLGLATAFPVVVILFLTTVLSILCGDDGIDFHPDAYGQYTLAIAAVGFTSTTSLLISGHTYFASIATANALGENKLTQALSQAGQVIVSTTRGVHLGATTITTYAVVHVFLVWVFSNTFQGVTRNDFSIQNGQIVPGFDYVWKNSTRDLAFFNMDSALLPGYTVNLLDKRSFVGLLFGGMLPLLFLALLLHRVFRAEPDFAANKEAAEVQHAAGIQSFLNVLLPYFILHFVTIFFGFVVGPIMHSSIMFGAIFSATAFAYAFGYSGSTLNTAWLSARRRPDARNAATLSSLRTIGNYFADAYVVTVFLKVLTLGSVILAFSVITVCHHSPIWKSHCYSPRA